MEELDKLKKDISDRYEMALALNGDEICKDIDSVLSNDLDLMRMKAHCYCLFYLKTRTNDVTLPQRCSSSLLWLHSA